MYTKQALLTTVKPIVRKAGEIVLSYFNKSLTRKEKKDHGFVTEADIATEQHLIQELGKAFPGTSFFAEESGKAGDSPYCWVIDPLDGTTNFAQRLGYFCISVALVHNGEPIFGMIYNPLLDELFYAYRGQGAFLNGKQIQVSEPKSLNTSIVVVGLPYTKDSDYRALLEKVSKIAPQTYTFRHFGAAALDQAYVADGRLDGVFFVKLGWWDVAAGILLIQEAGGKVSDFEGNPVKADYRSFVAGGPLMHKALRELLVS